MTARGSGKVRPVVRADEGGCRSGLLGVRSRQARPTLMADK